MAMYVVFILMVNLFRGSCVFQRGLDLLFCGGKKSNSKLINLPTRYLQQKTLKVDISLNCLVLVQSP